MFSTEERLIYKFKTAEGWRVCDPALIVDRIKFSYPKDSTFDRDAKLMQIPIPEKDEITDFDRNLLQERYDAMKRVCKFARNVFDLKELAIDEEGNVSGCTDSESILVFLDFSEYLESLKKNTGSGLNSLEVMEPVSSILVNPQPVMN